VKTRPLGATGLDVSVIGLGTVKIGRNQQVRYPRGFEIPDDSAVVELFELAGSLGINFIDTAPAYGSSEQRIGELLPDRDKWVIMTKVGEIFESGASRFDFSAEHTRASVEASLRRLRRDTLDVVLVHSDGNDMDIINHSGVFDALDKLKQQGQVRAYGMSSKTVEGGLWTVEHCDVVMATCNPDYNEELPVLQRARELNRGVVVKKALQSGHADAGAGGAGIERAFEFVLSQPGVSSMIVGTINPRHLRGNAELADRYADAGD